MRGLLLLALAFLTPAVAQARTLPPPSDPKSPIVVITYAPPPASLTCAEGSARLVEGATVPPRLWQIWTPPVSPVGMPAYTPPPLPSSETYGLSVNADGRVTDLKRLDPVIAGGADEASAIIASWRFAPGAPAKDCKIDLQPRHKPIAEALPATLYEMLANDVRDPAPALRQALGAAGDCTHYPYRRPRLVAYPDLQAFDDKTVDPAWAGLRYDIDGRGAVRNVEVVARHGEPAFSDTAVKAVARSRYFQGSPRKGCYIAFKAMPKATEAVARPSGDSLERPGDQCKVTLEALNLPENKAFPPAFIKRRVAGWAMLRFDVAPWGQIGAIEVIAAQPTQAFGEAGRSLLMGARPSPPATGYRGCVAPIIYAIPAVPRDGD